MRPSSTSSSDGTRRRRPQDALNPWLVLGAGAIVYAMCWFVLRPWTERTNCSLQAVEALSSKTGTLILGTSHVDCGVDPRLLGDDVMNLSGVALNYICMEGVLAGHLEDLPELKTLVVEADIFPLRYDTLDVIQKNYQLLLDLEPSVMAMQLTPREKLELVEWQVLHYSPLTSPFWSSYRLTPEQILAWDRQRPRREINGDGEGEIHPGFRSFAQTISSENDGAVKVATHTRESSADMIDRNADALVRILRMGVDRGLRVILLRLPHHATYRQSRRELLDAEYEQAMLRVRRSVDPDKVEYWDYDHVDTLSDAEFYDGDHLNGSGSRIFTLILKGRL